MNFLAAPGRTVLAPSDGLEQSASVADQLEKKEECFCRGRDWGKSPLYLFVSHSDANPTEIRIICAACVVKPSFTLLHAGDKHNTSAVPSTMKEAARERKRHIYDDYTGVARSENEQSKSTKLCQKVRNSAFCDSRSEDLANQGGGR